MDYYIYEHQIKRNKYVLIGYCRVSTTEQSLDRQIESLKNYGCEKIYFDKSTVKNFNRP
ncbi:hypothetical protein HMPREF3222_03142 [Clostridium perfringens]|uniref:Resolvase/invertase-type recombinase catalytic domain-containing protein n=1 Tax=Clostridium perfringens TaxID=1502 RepID=A0A133MM07_CLOPF|nr:hypothetical protein HMPREF3222_03142 [Clostridium perfringens]